MEGSNSAAAKIAAERAHVDATQACVDAAEARIAEIIMWVLVLEDA